MKAAYIIFAREKAHLAPYVERCVRSAFAQEGAPIEILLSDQGSKDGTRELLAKLAGEYVGPHTVRVLDCPDTMARGMAGLNAHVAWLHNQTDADVIIPSAVDDYAEPGRAAAMLEAFERTGADMVGTAMYFEDPTGQHEKSRSSYSEEGWVDMRAMVELKVGGSAGGAWRRSLWDRILPIPALYGFDVYMPPLACVLGGFYYVNKPLHTYCLHADASNTGLEGALRAAENDAAKRVIDEHRFFQTAGSWQWVLRRMEKLHIGSLEDRNWVRESALAHYEAWLDTRVAMTVNREPPQPFRF